MKDLTDVIVSCSRWEDIVSAKNAIIPELPHDVRKSLNRVFSSYLHLYGLEGVFERLSNRSVATILAEFDSATEPKPIASGEVDGLRYELFEAPDSADGKGHSAKD